MIPSSPCRAVLLSAALLLCLLLAASPAGAESDAQIWSKVGVDAGLCDRLTLSLEGDFRFGDDMSRFYRAAPDATLAYGFLDWLAVGLGYKQVFERIFDDDVAPGSGWRREYRPHIDARLSFAMGGFRLSNRNLFEYRIFEGTSYGLRYRNRTTVVPPMKWTAIGIEPFAAEEIFIDVKEGEFTRNRLSAGFSAEPWGHLRLRLYYMWQAQREADGWLNFHALATEIRFVF